MSKIDRHDMQRSIMHRSYGKLILCYADGHRSEVCYFFDFQVSVEKILRVDGFL